MKKKDLTLKLVTKLMVISVLVLSSLSLHSQEKEMQTLFKKSESVLLGGYGSFDIKGSQLDGGFNGLFLGWHGGVILNNSYVLGLAGYGLLPTQKVNPPSNIAEFGTNYHLSGGYGGLLFEYVNSPNKLLHFNINTIVGAAGLTYTDLVNKEHEINKSYPKSVSFVVEPGIEAELNISKFFRMTLGLSYRYAPNIKLRYNESDNQNVFNGVSVNLGFKFGEFTGIKTNSEL